MKWGLRKAFLGIAASAVLFVSLSATANTSSKQRARQEFKNNQQNSQQRNSVLLPAPTKGKPVTEIIQDRQADARFPKGPDATLTPGELCDRPESYRYAERIPYCGRHVDPQLKYEIIEAYERERGYQIQKLGRSKFKIDHYIPLCMGGANDRDNLWPQHESVYVITDAIEALSCEKMAEGRLKQAHAVEIIKAVKNDLSRADEVTRYLQAL